MLELAAIIVLGIFAQWIAWRMRIPAIFPLIIIGLFVGPLSILFLENQWINPENIFAGKTMYYFVSLSVGVILFEGGLTLKFKEVRKIAGVVRNLLIIGSVIMLVGGALAAHYILEMDYRVGLLFGSLIIVTGPTVIAPILQSVRPNRNVSTILKWEGILIDPIGALVAVLVFEFISAGEGHEFTQVALAEFGKIVLFGFTFGFTFAHALGFCIKKNIIPHYLLNVFTLATVLGVFVLADLFAHESGLLAVVVMGMVLGNINLPNIKELLYFIYIAFGIITVGEQIGLIFKMIDGNNVLVNRIVNIRNVHGILLFRNFHIFKISNGIVGHISE